MSKFQAIAAEVGALVTEKNKFYGDSFAKTGDFLRILYPAGIPPEQYGDALCMVRIFDKQMRVATAKDALGESPYRDIAGYAVLGIAKDAEQTEAHPFDLVAQGKLPAGFGPFVPHATEAKPTPLSLCAICAKADVSCPIYPKETQHCVEFRDKVEREALDLTLPSYALPCTEEEARAKHAEESVEWGQCLSGTMESLIEAWDIRQTAQTWEEVSQSAASAMALARAGHRLAEYYNHGEDVMKAKRIMMIKLAARHRYSDADCARILADV